jgi:hypothetical protein
VAGVSEEYLIASDDVSGASPEGRGEILVVVRVMSAATRTS